LLYLGERLCAVTAGSTLISHPVGALCCGDLLQRRRQDLPRCVRFVAPVINYRQVSTARRQFDEGEERLRIGPPQCPELIDVADPERRGNQRPQPVVTESV